MAPVYKFSNAGFLGRTYKSVLAENDVFDPTPPNAFDLLESEILTGTQLAVEFNSLLSAYGSDYQHLQIRFTARSNRPSQTADGAALFINGATTGYSQHNLRSDGSTYAAYGGNANELGFSLLPASNYPSNYFAAGYYNLPDAFETSKYKTLKGYWFTSAGTNAYRFLSSYSASLRSTNAIDSLKFQPNTGSFIAGTRFSLYGLKVS